MIARKKPFAAVAVFAVLGMTAVPALADSATPRNEIGVTATSIGFSSEQGRYGPWNMRGFEYRHRFDTGTVTAEVLTRDDRDRLVPTDGRFVGVGVTHDWAQRIYTYASVGFGHGRAFPNSSVYLETDVKTLASKALVLAIGASSTRYDSGARSQSYSLGPTYYWGPYSLTLRESVDTNSSSPTAIGSLLSFTATPNRKQSYALSGRVGPQFYQNRTLDLPVGDAAYDAREIDVVTKQYVTDRAGFALSGSLVSLRDRASGKQLFSSRGITGSLFVAF